MTEEGEEDSTFFLAEAVITDISSGAIGPLSVDEKISMMVQKETLPQFYYQTVLRIYVRKTC